jgi:hypothetical protein
MAEKLAIHIPPEANPSDAIKLISVLAEGSYTFDTASDLLKFVDKTKDVGARTELTSILIQLGLLHRDDDNKLTLSPLGYCLAKYPEDLYGELLHIMFYHGWVESQPQVFLSSWAYRKTCNDYYSVADIELSPNYLDRQVAEIIGNAEEVFTALGVEDFAGISFSRKSLRGALGWLKALNPSVITDDHFEQRGYCPPETLLLAIGYTLRDDPDAIDVDVLLSAELQEDICRACLLAPDYFEQTLDWMLPLYPDIITSDNEIGYYGRYIRLHKRPTLEDILR